MLKHLHRSKALTTRGTILTQLKRTKPIRGMGVIWRQNQDKTSIRHQSRTTSSIHLLKLTTTILNSSTTEKKIKIKSQYPKSLNNLTNSEKKAPLRTTVSPDSKAKTWTTDSRPFSSSSHRSSSSKRWGAQPRETLNISAVQIRMVGSYSVENTLSSDREVTSPNYKSY